MKKFIGSFGKYGVAAAIVTMALAFPAASFAKAKPQIDPPVKRSTTMICHGKGTQYYRQTLKFIPFNSLRDCLKSGGRMPKR